MAKGRWEKEEVEIHLRYDGPEVETGSMSVDDIVPVLQGFSGAYSKIAPAKEPDSKHTIRITGVRPGSADIVLEIWRFLGDNVDQIAALGVAGTVVTNTLGLIFAVIKLRKHTKKLPYKESINSENGIVVTNSQNVAITVTSDAYHLFASGRIDSEVGKMAKPLSRDRIDSVELSARELSGESISETINADEREYFQTEEIVVTITTEADYIVKLDSAFKGTNSGHLYLQGGKRVFYQYTGSDPTELHRLFGHSGPLRATCVAQLDAGMEVLRVEVRHLEIIQNDLALPSV